MLQHDIELLIAAAINRANGSYLTPTFAALNTIYTSGNYESLRSFVSAGYYVSNQWWHGSTGVIMTGDPRVGDPGRNDISGGKGNDVLYGGSGGYAFIKGGDGNDSIFGGLHRLGANGDDGNDFIVAGVGINDYSGANFLLSWKKILANAKTMSAEDLHKNFAYSNLDNSLYGGAGRDTILAPGDGNNELYGDGGASGDGDDLILAGNGNNTVYGGGGSDLIELGNGNNVISGGWGNDTIFAGSGNDTVNGEDGNDSIQVIGGINSVSGGLGYDTIHVEGTQSFIDGGANDDLITAVVVGSTISGGDGNDSIHAEGSSSFVNGDSGNDIIQTDGSAIRVKGGIGDDSIQATGERDTIYGDGGNDSIRLDGAANTANGGIGDDTIYIIGNNNSAYGDDDNDSIRIEGSGNTANGGIGDDSIHIIGDNNTAYGDGGNDVLLIDGSYSTIDGGTGDDVIRVIGTNNSNNNIEGGQGNDVIFVTGSNTTVKGGAGDDVIYISSDGNAIDGGDGLDIISYNPKDSGVTLSSAFWNDNTNVEGVVGTAFADQITGTVADEYIEGGGGQDTLDGGDGDDIIGFTGASQGVYASLQDGSARLADGTALGEFSNFEAIQGGAHNDTLAGNGGDNRLDGGAGDDSLSGGAGNDTLGGDVGSNTLDGGEGFDYADYNASAAAINVNFATGEISGGQADNDSLVSIEGIIGSAFDDTFTGGASASHFIGGEGNDLFNNGTGSATLDGGEGVDTVSYSGSGSGVFVDLATGGHGGSAEGDSYSGIEAVIGSAHNDTLAGDSGANLVVGGNGDDSISGGSGDDTLVGGLGSDTLDGGDGNNALSYAESNEGISVDLKTGLGHGGHAKGDVVRNVAYVVGSGFNDTFAGSDTISTTLDGGAGNDMFAASQAATSHLGGDGVDTVSYERSDAAVQVDLSTGNGAGGWAQGDAYNSVEAVAGSRFNDTITGNLSANVLDGGGGNDSIIGIAGSNTLRGGAGNDTLISGSGADFIDGGDGFDLADYSQANSAVSVDLRTGSASGGSAEGDTLISIEGVVGSNAGDVLHGGNAASSLEGGGGNDTLYSHVTGTTLLSGAGNDYLYGSGSGETLLGGEGNDFISAIDSGVIDGGEGTDTLSYAAAATGRYISLQTGNAQGAAESSGTISNIEHIVGSDHDDTIIGNASGYETLYGGNGNDSVIVYAAETKILGGVGTDTVDYSQSDAGVTIGLDGAVGTGDFAQGDSLADVEVLIGSQHADSLKGSTSSDTIFGGAGNDTIAGGAGADLIDGGAGEDVVSYAASSSGVNVNLSTGNASGGEAQSDTLVSVEHIIGSNNNDTLIGNADANRLVGGAGNDSLVGGSGNDTLDGGIGADTLDGGDGMDAVDYGASNAAVTINLSTGQGSGGYAQGDTLISVEQVTGSNYNDYFIAGSQAAFIDGGQGSDRLSYSLSTGGVSVDLAAGTGSGGYAEGDTLAGIEHLIGSQYDDTLLGSEGGEIFQGGVGADSIDGRGGADTVTYNDATGAVNVDLQSGIGISNIAEGDRLNNIEALIGSIYNDTLSASEAGSTLMASLGNDFYIAGAGADSISDGSGSDTVDYSRSTSGVSVNLSTGSASGGSAEGDTLIGIDAAIGSGHGDTLAAGPGATLSGGAGDDLLIQTSAGAMTFDGGVGRDTVDFSAMTRANIDLLRGNAWVVEADNKTFHTDTLSSIEGVIGTDSYDVITGSAGDDVINAGAGNDQVYATAGDTVDGGEGNDAVYFSNSATGVNVTLGGEQIRNVETVLGSTHNDTIIGSAANEQIVGSQGADSLDGGAGNDTLTYATSTAGVTVNLATGEGSGGFAEGDRFSGFEVVGGSSYGDVFISGAGADILDGKNGNDTVDYSASTEAVNVNLTTGTAQGGYAEGDGLYNIEAVTGSGHGDTLAAGSGATLSGGAGDDLLVQTSAGAMTFDGGEGRDTVDFSGMGRANINLLTGAAWVFRTDSTVSYVDMLSSIEGVIGTDSYDVITGSAGDDVINAGAGNDQVYATAGDTVDGGADNDFVNFSNSATGVNVTLGGEQIRNVETIAGSTYNDTIIGSAVNERFVGSQGADSLDGGAGTDTLTYVTSTAGVTVNFATGTGSGGFAEGDKISGFEVVEGSNYGDVFISAAAAESLDGGYGLDTVDYSASTEAVNVNLVARTAQGGYAQGDWLYNIEAVAGSGHGDTLTGGYNQALSGGAGDDLLVQAYAGAMALDGGEGRDSVDFSGMTNVNVNLATGTASVLGTTSTLRYTDTLSSIEGVIGTAGHDTITGSAGDDVINAGAGNDQVYATAGDTVDGGAGNDAVNFSNSATGVNVTLGGEQIRNVETIAGSTHNDTIIGSAANEQIVGSFGADSLDGGEGNDTLDYTNSVSGVTLNLATGTGIGSGIERGDRFSGFEVFLGSNYGDVFISGAAGEIIGGGNGNDTVDYSASTEAVNVNLNNTPCHGGYAEGDRLVNIEMVIGSDYNDTLTGGYGQLLSGGVGDDLFSMPYAQQMTFDGGEGRDTVDFSNMLNVNVNLATGTASVLGTAVTFRYADTLISIEGVIGTSGNDTITGSAADEIIFGSLGSDSLVGGRGIDTLSYENSNAAVTFDLSNGNASIRYDVDRISGFEHIIGSNYNDFVVGCSASVTLDGGAGYDTVSYWNSTGAVNVNLAAHTGQGGFAQGDYYLNIEAVTGSDYGDTILGSEGDNRLDGGAGNDILTGGMRNDTLIGGAGQDVFAFAGQNAGSDVIVDFNAADGDILAIQTQNGSISLGYIDNNSNLGAGSFAQNNVLAYQDGNNTYVYGDMDGDGNYSAETDLLVTLSGVQQITAEDITFYSGS